MESKILFENRIEDSAKFIAITCAVLGVLLNLRFYDPFILSFFLSSLIISVFAYTSEKKSFFPIIFLGVPFIILVITFFNISFTGENILFFIPLQILTFGGLIYYFSGSLFEYLWSLNNGFLMKKWTNLDKKTLNERYNEITLVVFFLLIFHIILTLTSLFSNSSIFAIEQGGISILLLYFAYWFFRNRKKIKEDTKQIAASLFFIFIIIISFDVILSQISFLLNHTNGLVFFLPIILLISLLSILLGPEHKRQSKK